MSGDASISTQSGEPDGSGHKVELSPRPAAARAAARLLERKCRRSDRQVGLVLMHHEVAAIHGDLDHDLLPAQGSQLFQAQLGHLRRHYDVVPLRELVARARGRSPGQRLPVALTFDDDFASHESIVAPMLERFGFPATFFLNGNTLRGPSSFWWQDLQTILDQGPEAWSNLRHELAESWPWARLDGRIGDLTDTIEALPPDQRDAVAGRLRDLAGPDGLDPGLPPDKVKALADRGFEIGFHTLRHYRLPTLEGKELDRAMSEGVDELAEVVGYRPTAIGYPHGKADLRVAEAAQRAGFDLGFVCTHAATNPEQHPLLLERVSGLTGSLGSFAWALGRLAAAG